MLFGADAKALFFIDDDQTEIFKSDVFADDPMSSNQNIELAALGVAAFASMAGDWREVIGGTARSEEHTSELQSH